MSILGGIGNMIGAGAKGAGDGLGWGLNKAGSGLAWGGKQAFAGGQTFMQSWSLLLNKTYGLIDPRLGAAVGAVPGAAGGGLGIGSSIFGAGFKGLLFLGFAGLAAVGLVAGLAARLSPANLARRVAMRSRMQRAQGASRGVHRKGRHEPVVVVKVGRSGSGLVKLIVLLLLFVSLTPYTMEQVVNGGRRIWPGSYAGGAGVQPAAASCGMTAQGGYLRLASDTGRVIHTAVVGTINPAAWAAKFEGAGRAVGHFLGALKMGAESGSTLAPVAAPTMSPAQQVADFSCCATTAPALPAGGVPAAYTPGQADTAAMTAARAAQAAGWSGSELVMAVAVAGAESGWNPLAENPASSAKGLWQIMMSLHADKFNGALWQDPAANARVAKVIYDDAGGWSPWSVFTSGAYQSRMAEAQAAVTAIGVAPLPVAVPVASCTVPSSSGGVFPSAFDQLGNPNGVEQALNWDAQMAANQTPVVEFRCDHYVAEAYGWSSSGSVTARAHWEAIPASLKHVGADGVPPRGAIVFFNTSAAGHVAVSDGAGNVYTTDRIAGRITLETLAHIDGWGGRLGWAAPYFVGHSHLPAATTA